MCSEGGLPKTVWIRLEDCILIFGADAAPGKRTRPSSATWQFSELAPLGPPGLDKLRFRAPMACRRRCDWTRRRDEAAKRPPKGHHRPTLLSGAHLRFLQSWKASYTGDGGPCIKITLGSAPCQQYGIIAQHECSETAKCPHGPKSLTASTPIYCGAVPPPYCPRRL
jgi:hypothetical protein